LSTQLIKINKFIQSNNNLTNIIDHCKDYKSKSKSKIYIVGGIIRDILTESKSELYDLDIVIDGDIEDFVYSLSNEYQAEINKAHEFLNYKLILNNSFEIDVAHSRKESYQTLGKLPKWNKANISEDLFRRDFSINSIALEITKQNLELIDPLDGILDIDKRSIRILHDKSFKDDPTRIYRAFKYKSRLDFTFESKTEMLLNKSIEYIKYVSDYRKNKEIIKYLNEPDINKILGLIYSSEYYKNLLPKYFMSKINFIDEKIWQKMSTIEKIFFALFEVNKSDRNDFLTSLNISKLDMKNLLNLFEIKKRLQNNELINRVDLNVSDDIISNLYHCL